MGIVSLSEVLRDFVLILLKVAAVVGHQSHASFNCVFKPQVYEITRFDLLATSDTKEFSLGV